MISELYDALRAAGAPDDQARKAAEDIRLDVADVKSDVRLLKCMLGFNLAASVGIVMILLRQ